MTKNSSNRRVRDGSRDNLAKSAAGRLKLEAGILPQSYRVRLWQVNRDWLYPRFLPESTDDHGERSLRDAFSPDAFRGFKTHGYDFNRRYATTV